MTIRENIILEAISWVDTPYHHKAMVKGVGVDCAMLIAGVAKSLDIITPDVKIPNYNVQWHLHNKEEMLLEILDEFGCKRLKDKTKAKAGDIITFQFGRVTSHLGILINNNQIVHARLDIGKVVINDLDEDLLSRWTQTLKFPGVK